jgi:hypothetical protein
MTDEASLNCGHVSVPEIITAHSPTEVSLQGSLVFSGWETVEREPLEILARSFSTV